MTNEEIDLAGATHVTREFIRSMLGNLQIHTYCIVHAGIKENNYAITCSLIIPYSREKIYYSFLVSKQGVIKKMELVKNG